MLTNYLINKNQNKFVNIARLSIATYNFTALPWQRVLRAAGIFNILYHTNTVDTLTSTVFSVSSIGMLES